MHHCESFLHVQGSLLTAEFIVRTVAIVIGLIVIYEVLISQAFEAFTETTKAPIKTDM